MSDLQDIRALVFDVFGTVADWCGGVAREAVAMLAPNGYALDWTAFAHRWRAEYQPAMEAVRTGARPFVVLVALHREMLAPVLADYGLRDLGGADITEPSHAWRKLDPWPREYGATATPKERPEAGRFDLYVDSFIELADRLSA